LEIDTLIANILVYLFIHSSIHIKIMPQQKQLETSKTTAWNKWLTQDNTIPLTCSQNVTRQIQYNI